MRKISYAKGILDLFKDKSLYVTWKKASQSYHVDLVSAGKGILGRISITKDSSCPWEVIWSATEKKEYLKYGYMKKRKTVIPWLKANGVWREL